MPGHGVSLRPVRRGAADQCGIQQICTAGVAHGSVGQEEHGVGFTCPVGELAQVGKVEVIFALKHVVAAYAPDVLHYGEHVGVEIAEAFLPLLGRVSREAREVFQQFQGLLVIFLTSAVGCSLQVRLRGRIEAQFAGRNGWRPSPLEGHVCSDGGISVHIDAHASIA